MYYVYYNGFYFIRYSNSLVVDYTTCVVSFSQSIMRFPFLFQCSLARKGIGSGSGHENLVVRALVPFDEQITPGECHADLVARRNFSGLDGGNHQGTRTGTTCQGGAGTSFPDLHFQVCVRHNLYELDVGLGGEGFDAGFEGRAVRFEIDVVFQIVDKDNAVGIPHADGADLPVLSVAFEVLLHHGDTVLKVGSQCCGNIRSLQDGFPHVYRDRSVVVHDRNDATGEGVDLVGFGIGSEILQKLREAPDAVPAHFWFASVRVVDSHGKIVVVRGWFEGENNTVSADAKVSVAELL
mmetsp:Transcript_19867/g.41881  ORF Transcript_19867/g.41881 Transcript_19867/m.41881 type:complete len:295 (-) Transcript_19867:362-1246(-)